MLQRLTLIVRLQRHSAAQDWHGQVEMVNPHREAVFRDRDELLALLEEWTAQSTLPGEPPSANATN
jgi:hypothetical protein